MIGSVRSNQDSYLDDLQKTPRGSIHTNTNFEENNMGDFSADKS